MKIYTQKPNIKISEEVKAMLDKIGNKGDRYEDIIVRLIKSNRRLKK